jgi:hypothetical protein
MDALYSNTTGYYNTASGVGALSYNTTGYSNTAMGNSAGVSSGNLSNATAIGYNATVDASNHIRIGNILVTQIGGQVAWSNLSDMREKEDIQETGYGIDFIRSLRPVEFRMKNGNGRLDLGFIAQDVEALLGAEYNILGIGGTEERKLSLRYTDFIAPIVKAMQEQQDQIESQQAVIESQQTEIETLKSRLEKIETLLSRVN